MPGIVGIITRKPENEAKEVVASMLGSMMHERFYKSGTCFASDCGVYLGWVGLEQPSAASQPRHKAQNGIEIVWSGEWFPDNSESAPDWLAVAYAKEGQECFRRLNGVFSGVIIDKNRRRAVLFNDRFGFDRVYWYQGTDAFYFASEAKALLRVLPELRSFDKEGLRDFLSFGCTLSGRTLFRGVQTLPGAACWTFDNGSCLKASYFSPEVWEAQEALEPEDFQSELDATFKRVLPRYFESSSRLGISLTAGLDTRMIMAGLPASRSKPICYTFAGPQSDTLDARIARRVAGMCGLEHQVLRIERDFFSNFSAISDRTVHITDGYFGVVGAHEVYLNAKARELAPIRLTGVFGSEILRGTSTFKPLGFSHDLLHPDVKLPDKDEAERMLDRGSNEVSFAAFKEIPWNIYGSVAACRSQVSFRTPYLDNAVVSLAFRTPRALQRSPTTALRFVNQNEPVLAGVPTDMGLSFREQGYADFARNTFSKITFKLDYLSNDGLPDWLSPLDPLFDKFGNGKTVLGLHKFLRYRRWFRTTLAGYLTDALSDPQLRRSSLWNQARLERMAQDHIGGRGNFVQEINTVLTLNAVERLLLNS